MHAHEQVAVPQSDPVHAAEAPSALETPASAASSLVALGRAADSGSQRRAIEHLQRLAGSAAIAAALGSPPASLQRSACGCPACCTGTNDEDVGPPTDVQRQAVAPLAVQRKPENEQALAAIQGEAMFRLLPLLAAKPEDVRKDEEAGGKVGGPRLQTAMRVVAGRGTPWLDFVGSHNGELAALPADQIGDVITFLGAPKEARYYKAPDLGGKFDGAVDPGGAIITIFFRVKFAFAEGLRFGAASAGTPQWEKELKEGKAKFPGDFKRVVEETWSGKGTVKPTCPFGPIKEFQTKVSVQVVESGEHATFTVYPGTGRSWASSEAKEGGLSPTANEPETSEHQVVDPTGRRPEQVTTRHITSAHEFGHSLGLKHVHCPGSEDKCYGVTAEESQDVMGRGDKLQVIMRGGKVVHDDFEPFERIGERWGKDVFPGALTAKCNKWTGAGGG